MGWIINLISFDINYFMYLQGIIEVIIGLFLIIGLFTRIVAFLSGMITASIILILFFNPASIGHFSQLHIDKDIFPLLLNDVLLRDLGLFAISASLFLLGGGKILSLDEKIKNE